jgi:hypothetical protein
MFVVYVTTSMVFYYTNPNKQRHQCFNPQEEVTTDWVNWHSELSELDLGNTQFII